MKHLAALPFPALLLAACGRGKEPNSIDSITGQQGISFTTLRVKR